jgi:PhoD-like phosphatase
MLGDSQWQWLESTLKHSPADFHIVVSSVQVLTTNPVVESWGHFPEEKKRLLKLMEYLDPPGLVFLSGDVHHGELSRARVVRGSREDMWVEVTSSGLTHTCGDSFINKILCPNMLRTFSKHRLPSSDNHDEDIPSTKHRKSDTNVTVRRENFYIGKNFGLIVDASNETMFSLNISVMGVESNRAELTHIVHSVRNKCSVSDNSANVLEESTESVPDASTCVSDPILRILTDDFPNYVTPEMKRNGGLIAMVIGVALVLITSFFVWAYSGKKPRRKTH